MGVTGTLNTSLGTHYGCHLGAIAATMKWGGAGEGGRGRGTAEAGRRRDGRGGGSEGEGGGGIKRG